MELQEIYYVNPNDMIRSTINFIYLDAKRRAAFNKNVKDIPHSFKRIMDAIKKNNILLYNLIMKTMYIDYTIYKYGLSDREKKKYINLGFISTFDDLIEGTKDDELLLDVMVNSTAKREIDIPHIYRCMGHITKEDEERLMNISPTYVYDLIEMRFPFVMFKMHRNLLFNEFTKDSSSKNVALRDLLNEMKESDLKDYRNALTFFLEVFYKHKKYAIVELDSLLPQKEKQLFETLDDCKLDNSIDLLIEDKSLLESVISIYTDYYFSRNEIVEEVDRFHREPERKEKLNLIFINHNKNNQ